MTGNLLCLTMYPLFLSDVIVMKLIINGVADSTVVAMMDNFYRNSLTTTSPPPPTEFTPCGLTIMVLVGCGSVIGYVIMSLIVRKLASRCEGRT